MAESADRFPDEQSVQRLIDQMRADRGYLYPEVEMAVRMDPRFMAAYKELFDQVFLYHEEDEGRAALSGRHRELIVVALLAQRGRLDHVVVHIRRAMELGASAQEVLEALETTLAPAGLPAFLTGLEALAQVLGERDKKKTKEG